MFTLTERRAQLGVEVRPHSGLPSEALASVITESLHRPPVLPLKVVLSAHAIDVVPSESSKVGVIESVQARCDGAILAIGDQGQLGGNDFELLAATPHSLSVDRCSADPTRCWNLDTTGARGPKVLLSYLETLNQQTEGVRFLFPRP
jgi:hypothetical protein